MKTKSKFANTEEKTKVLPAAKLDKTELLIKDAAYDTLYSNTEKNPTVLWVLRKEVKPGYALIVFWAEICGEWLELTVKDSYKLSTETKSIVYKMRRKPTDRTISAPDKFKTKLGRKISKTNKEEKAAAKREGREPKLVKRVITANVDPATNIKIGTRKHEMATVLLSSTDAKKVRNGMETLIKKFIAEKPNSTYDRIGLSRYTDQLIKWTATDGNVKKELFTNILSALGL